MRTSLASCEKAPDHASLILVKKKTVGEPTAEFREETHTKNVCVAIYMNPAIILVNPTDPFFV